MIMELEEMSQAHVPVRYRLTLKVAKPHRDKERTL